MLLVVLLEITLVAPLVVHEEVNIIKKHLVQLHLDVRRLDILTLPGSGQVQPVVPKLVPGEVHLGLQGVLQHLGLGVLANSIERGDYLNELLMHLLAGLHRPLKRPLGSFLFNKF